MHDLLPQLQKLLTHKKSKKFYAERLNITEEEVDGLLKELRSRPEEGQQEEDIYMSDGLGVTTVIPKMVYQTTTTEVNVDRGTLKSTIEADFEPRSDEDLAKLHNIDLTNYKISNYWSKRLPNGKFTSSVFCTLIKLDSDINYQKQFLLDELKEELPQKAYIKLNRKGDYAYEISIPDIHFGKLAWSEESGEDYDLDIAEKRFTQAIEELLYLINVDVLDRIVFPIGNDMINVDSRRNETFAGTRQDCDSRFFKMVRTAKDILIRTIDALQLIAPVDVIVIAGNHDSETMFMLGEVIEAYYHNNDNVTVDNTAKQRKYYQYGLNSFQYTHGNEETHKDLGLIFATEQAKLWAATKFRFCKLGHFHKNKKIDYVSIDEHQGFQVQVLPSLSGSDAWHSSKGYNSMKQAKGFLYHKTKGKVAEYTYSI